MIVGESTNYPLVCWLQWKAPLCKKHIVESDKEGTSAGKDVMKCIIYAKNSVLDQDIAINRIETQKFWLLIRLDKDRLEQIIVRNLHEYKADPNKFIDWNSIYATADR